MTSRRDRLEKEPAVRYEEGRNPIRLNAWERRKKYLQQLYRGGKRSAIRVFHSGPGGSKLLPIMPVSHDMKHVRNEGQGRGIPGNFLQYMKGREVHGVGGLDFRVRNAADSFFEYSEQRQTQRENRNNLDIQENNFEVLMLKRVALSNRLFANSIERKCVRLEITDPTNNELPLFKAQVNDLRFISGSYEHRMGELMDMNYAITWESDTSLSDGYSSSSSEGSHAVV